MDEIVVRTSMHKCRQTCAFFISLLLLHIIECICVRMCAQYLFGEWSFQPVYNRIIDIHFQGIGQYPVAGPSSTRLYKPQNTKHKTHNSWRSWKMYHDNGSMIHFYFSECPLQTPRPADTAWSWPYSGAAIQCRPEARDNNYSSYRYHDSSIRSLEPRQW
jgi:hypothetical protein